MMTFSGPSPPLPLRRDVAMPPSRPLSNKLSLLKHRPVDPSPSFDSDDEDDFDLDDHFAPTEPFDDMHNDPRRKLLAHKPAPPAVPKIKKSVKVVPKRPGTDPKNIRSSTLPELDDLGIGKISLADVRSSRWEDMAYAIVRKQKLRNMAAELLATKPAEKKEETISPPQRSSSVIRDDPISLRLQELELEQKCAPLIRYLVSLGLNPEHLQGIARRHKGCFHVKLTKVQERMDYLASIGVKEEDLSKIIIRHPQVLEYTVERMMKPRIEYLQSIGIPDAKLGRVITVAPSLLECSLERSLKRRVRFLLEEAGVNGADVWKVVVLSPQVLTQSIEDSLRPRLHYLLKKLGASQERVAKMVTKHPQLFHYSVEDGIQPRIEFLRSLGMSNSDVVKVLSRCSQILSLSVEKSLKPKSEYLTTELKCGVSAVTSFPAYFTLSLDQRIRPRHQFLKSLKKLPQGPFPMNILAATDDDFCERWAKATVQEYNAFRQKMLLNSFARNFERKNRLQVENK